MRYLYSKTEEGKELLISKKDLKKFTQNELYTYLKMSMSQKLYDLYGDRIMTEDKLHYDHAKIHRLVNLKEIPEYYDESIFVWYNKKQLIEVINEVFNYDHYILKNGRTSYYAENMIFIKSKTTLKKFFNPDGTFKF